MILARQLEMRLVIYYGLLLKSRDEIAERFILHFLFQMNTIASHRSNLLKIKKCVQYCYRKLLQILKTCCCWKTYQRYWLVGLKS